MAKASLKIPKKMAVRRANLLKALDHFTGPASTPEIREVCEQEGWEVPSNPSAELYALTHTSGYLKATKNAEDNTNRYQFTKLGEAVAAALLDGKIVVTGTTGSAPAKVAKSRPAKPVVEAAPAPVNISKSADALADNISAVLRENAEYRDLLQKIHNQIGHFLQLNPDE